MYGFIEGTQKQRGLVCNANGALKVDGSISPVSSGGLQIPAHDRFEITYYGSTSNVQSIIYRLGATTTVATQTFTYENNTVEGSRLLSTIVVLHS
jgi:hypothetical protein